MASVTAPSSRIQGSIAIPPPPRPARIRSRSQPRRSTAGTSSAPKTSMDQDYVFVPDTAAVRAAQLLSENQMSSKRPRHHQSASISDSELHSEAGGSHSSHDALLPPAFRSPFAPRTAISGDTPLLTLNTLDPHERAALVRQSKKLGKVLGAVPFIAEMPSMGPAMGVNLQRRGTVAAPEGSYYRNMTEMSLDIGKEGRGLHRGKSSKSLLPSPSQATTSKAPVLHLTPSPNIPYPEPIPRRSESSASSRGTGASFTFAKSTSSIALNGRQSLDERSLNHSVSTSNLSNHESPSTPNTPAFLVSNSAALSRQQTRARMAKVQQLTGELVPSELVMGPAPSAALVPKSSHSMRKRRASVDLPPVVANEVAQTLKHKRSRSMWRKEAKENMDVESAPESTGDNLLTRKRSKSKSRAQANHPPIPAFDSSKGSLTEKQKAIHVKRALKMAQVFGVPIPDAMYEVQNMPVPSREQMENITRSVSRQSLASLAYMLDHDRDSLYDLLSTAPDEGDEDEEPVDWPYEKKGDASVSASTDPASSTKPKEPSNENSMSLAVERMRKLRKEPSASAQGLDRTFTVRRRRATKLSRFFGVGYQELFTAVLYGVPGSPETASPPALPDRAAAPSLPTITHLPPLDANKISGGTVSVQTDKGKETVLRTSTNTAATVKAEDMEEVMSRLRALR